MKRWKLSDEDLRNRARWTDYETAVADMFRETSTVQRPWVVIPANDKKYARIAVFEAVIDCLEAGFDMAPPDVDPKFERRARKALGLGEAAGRKQVVGLD